MAGNTGTKQIRSGKVLGFAELLEVRADALEKAPGPGSGEVNGMIEAYREIAKELKLIFGPSK